MNSRDLFKVILTAYGYSKDISIDIESGYGPDNVYTVYASNPENKDEISVVGVSIMDTVYEILNYFHSNKEIYPVTHWLETPLLDVLNNDKREKITDIIYKRKIEIEQAVEENKWRAKIQSDYNPCEGCMLNKKDHWDNIHYNCEEFHTMRCEFMKEFYSLLSKLSKCKDSNSEEAKNIIRQIKLIKEKTNKNG